MVNLDGVFVTFTLFKLLHSNVSLFSLLFVLFSPPKTEVEAIHKPRIHRSKAIHHNKGWEECPWEAQQRWSTITRFHPAFKGPGMSPFIPRSSPSSSKAIRDGLSRSTRTDLASSGKAFLSVGSLFRLTLSLRSIVELQKLPLPIPSDPGKVQSSSSSSSSYSKTKTATTTTVKTLGSNAHFAMRVFNRGKHGQMDFAEYCALSQFLNDLVAGFMERDKGIDPSLFRSLF